MEFGVGLDNLFNQASHFRVVGQFFGLVTIEEFAEGAFMRVGGQLYNIMVVEQHPVELFQPEKLVTLHGHEKAIQAEVGLPENLAD